MICSLHQGYMGHAAMLKRAQGNIFWPGIANDLKEFVTTCSHCQLNRPSQQKQPMLSIAVPPAPGLGVASDYFTIKCEEFVLFTDIFSGWTEYFKTLSRTPETLIQCLLSYMARNGVQRKIYSDQGSAYKNHEFLDFCKALAIDFALCSGEYPQVNGTAEAAVKRVKKWISGTNTRKDLTHAIITWHQTKIAF